MEVEAGGARQVGRLDDADDRSAARTGLEPDQSLDLEDAQRLAQRRAADVVLRRHRRLEREVGAAAEAARDDVADDLTGDALGRLLRPSPRRLAARRHVDEAAQRLGGDLIRVVIGSAWHRAGRSE